MDWNNPLIYVIGAGTLGGGLYGMGRLIWAFAEWKGRNDASVKAIKETIKTIRTDIKKILLGLSPQAEVSSENPLKLTDFGRTLSEDVGGHEWAQETAAQLADKLRGRQPFEIHEYAAEYVMDDDHFTDELHRKIRECAYNRGAIPEQVRNVLAIELRDALLRS